MISEKLYTKKELLKEHLHGSTTLYIIMLEHNNRLLKKRLKAAVGFLELQENYLPPHLGFMWREIVLKEK